MMRGCWNTRLQTYAVLTNRYWQPSPPAVCPSTGARHGCAWRYATRRSGMRAKRCTSEIRRGRLRKATGFYDAAVIIEGLAGDGDEVGDAYVTLCVHAGIAGGQGPLRAPVKAA